MVESVTSAVIEKALDTVLRKVSEGRKLSTEDLVVLMLGLFREIRNDIANTNKRIDTLYEMMSRNYEALNSRINEVNDSLIKKIDEINKRLVEKIDETNKRIDAINDSLSKRIDNLYDLLGKIYEALIKGDNHTKAEGR